MYLNVAYLGKLSGAKESFGLQTVTMVADEIRMLNNREKCQSHHVTQNQKDGKLSFKVDELPS